MVCVRRNTGLHYRAVHGPALLLKGMQGHLGCFCEIVVGCNPTRWSEQDISFRITVRRHCLP